MSVDLRVKPGHTRPPGPVVIAVLDGVGVGLGDEADAVYLAATPTLDTLRAQPGRACQLRAHGTAVGLPSDSDMGNSEVGHNALGSGQIARQGAVLVNAAIASGALFEGKVWGQVMERGHAGKTIHFIGLLSDGNVHSHIDHLVALLRAAARGGATRLRVHPLLDGRDVPATSALEYVAVLESVLTDLREEGVDARVASGGGRMTTTMDRYEADWSIVERGWNAHVRGRARHFESLRRAIEILREENPGIGDQNLPEFTIAEGGEPVGPITDGDAVVFFNFRGDRAIEISRAFDDDALEHFDRSPRPEVFYCGMMEYDGDTHIPKNYLVSPPSIANTSGELLARAKLSQLAISETQKYGHVTYFWNGNRSGAFDPSRETYIEIDSDVISFDERPAMKAVEITDRLIAELQTGKYQLARVNYANGDMVGHTGKLEATIRAVQVVDHELGRLRRAVEEMGGILLVTADHGNADEMYFHDPEGNVVRDSQGRPKVRTSHSLSPVPFMIADPRPNPGYHIDAQAASGAGIANVAAVVYELLGFEPPEFVEKSFLTWKS